MDNERGQNISGEQLSPAEKLLNEIRIRVETMNVGEPSLLAANDFADYLMLENDLRSQRFILGHFYSRRGTPEEPASITFVLGESKLRIIELQMALLLQQISGNKARLPGYGVTYNELEQMADGFLGNDGKPADLFDVIYGLKDSIDKVIAQTK